jgi:hypothetical protein
MWSRRQSSPTQDSICVSDRVRRRVATVPVGQEQMTIEGLMAQIGSIITHRSTSDPEFEEAIMASEAVLALLHQMKVTGHDFLRS